MTYGRLWRALPVLALALVLGGVSAAAQNAADLVFTGDELAAVVESIETAREARRRALENFGFSALYNLVATPAAMFGLVNPFVAALAMSGSRSEEHTSELQSH